MDDLKEYLFLIATCLSILRQLRQVCLQAGTDLVSRDHLFGAASVPHIFRLIVLVSLFALLDDLDLSYKLEECIDEHCFNLEFHFLHRQLQSLVLFDVDVLIHDLRVCYHSLNERSVVFFYIDLVLYKLLYWAEEDVNEVVEHVVDLNMIDLQVILGD
jgi:hypothetical protein